MPQSVQKFITAVFLLVLIQIQKTAMDGLWWNFSGDVHVPLCYGFFSSSKVWNVVLSGAFLGHDDVTSLLTLHQSCIYRGHKAKQHFFFLFFLIIWLLFGPKSKRRRKHRNSLEWCISKSLWLIGLFIFALMRPRCSKVLLLHTFKPGITRTTLPLTDTPSIT